ncbi:MAG: pyridoxal-dependent decarboxylase [Faecousia sp.]
MELKTPYYVIHKEELDESLERLTEALRTHWSNYIIGYSYKTNALPWIISYFNQKGCFAEVVSDDERRLSERIQVPKGRVIYNGPIKTKDSFIDALINGAYVNIDSQREIEWLEEIAAGDYNLGIRVNFDIEKMCPQQSQCGDEGGRFGFCYENGELSNAVKRIEQKGKKLNGLHLHVSSKTRSLDIYKAIAQMACEIADKYEIELDFIDVGGGFFGGLPTKPSFDEYIKTIASILKEKFDPHKTKLIVEPGMALIGAPVSYVTSVIDVKDTSYGRFVITDGSRTSIDPLMTKRAYFHRYERSRDTELMKKQVVCGYTCMEHDRLFEANDEPELINGDRIIYNKVGAYTMCLTPLFIKYFPDVYVEENGKMKKVRSTWTPEEYMQNSELY